MDVVSIRHRGLRRFFERGEVRGLAPDRVGKIRRIMTAVDNATTLDELDTLPGWRLHRLQGDRRGTWSISVSGNWRLTFRIRDDQIFELDLEDYH